MDSLFINALASQNKARKPVWIMRQAGRFLPEYRRIKEKHSLMEMFSHPELIHEITTLPVEILKTDAAILFSDITILAKAFGRDLSFKDGIGPVISPRIQSKEDILSLKVRPVQDALRFLFQAIKSLKKGLKIPLIGFCGAPFTFASYLIEERHSQELHLTKRWLYQDAKSFLLLLEKITNATLSYLSLQIEAGVHAIQIFDSFAHVLTKPLWKLFCFPFLKRLVGLLKKKQIPVIIFMRGSCLYAEELSHLEPNAISFDWQQPLAELRKRVPYQIALQGNFDPHLLLAPKKTIQKCVKETLQKMHKEAGYIVNLGHGILPETEVDKAKCFIQTVHDYG